jgi:uncharacterized repeat protein (TIGR01451 family)
MRMRMVVGMLCAGAAAIALGAGDSPVRAQTVQPCDFLTGGGFIYPQGQVMGTKGTLAIAGGCKHGSGSTPPVPYWGHLQYHDHGINLKVHGTEITAYLPDLLLMDPKARLICGNGRTDAGTVTFLVRAKDGKTSGTPDTFDIQVAGATTYSTFGGGPHPLGGGNIELHKPNPSNSGTFGGVCPLLATGGADGPDVTVVKSTSTPTVSGGDPISFDIVVENIGGSEAIDVTVIDSLPRGPEFTVTWTTSTPGCLIDAVTQILTCSFASLPPLAPITITVTATPAATECSSGSDPTPTFINQATVTASNEAAGQQGNNTSNIATIRAGCNE